MGCVLKITEAADAVSGGTEDGGEEDDDNYHNDGDATPYSDADLAAGGHTFLLGLWGSLNNDGLWGGLLVHIFSSNKIKL